MFTLPLILLLYNDESLIIIYDNIQQLQVGGAIGPGKGKALGSAIYLTFNNIAIQLLQLNYIYNNIQHSPDGREIS